MPPDSQELPVDTHTYERRYEGGLVWCICCKDPLSANKSIFGVSPYFPFYPPDHFCKECAEALDVVPTEIES
jgi:hypothetical protein